MILCRFRWRCDSATTRSHFGPLAAPLLAELGLDRSRACNVGVAGPAAWYVQIVPSLAITTRVSHFFLSQTPSVYRRLNSHREQQPYAGPFSSAHCNRLRMKESGPHKYSAVVSFHRNPPTTFPRSPRHETRGPIRGLIAVLLAQSRPSSAQLLAPSTPCAQLCCFFFRVRTLPLPFLMPFSDFPECLVLLLLLCRPLLPIIVPRCFCPCSCSCRCC